MQLDSLELTSLSGTLSLALKTRVALIMTSLCPGGDWETTPLVSLISLQLLKNTRFVARELIVDVTFVVTWAGGRVNPPGIL